MGFRLYTIDDDLTNFVAPGLNNLVINFVNRASAGLDCVGFAQRSASYRENTYAWTTLGGGFPFDRAEGNDDPDETVRAGRAGYPHANGSSFAITARAIISENRAYFTINAGQAGGPTMEQFGSLKRTFQKIVPGEIIRYERAHIGIVESVDKIVIDTSLNIAGLMRTVKAIEAVFSMNINYVVKRNMLQGNGESFTELQPQSWHLGATINNITPMRFWSIERLRTN